MSYRDAIRPRRPDSSFSLGWISCHWIFQPSVYKNTFVDKSTETYFALENKQTHRSASALQKLDSFQPTVSFFRPAFANNCSTVQQYQRKKTPVLSIMWIKTASNAAWLFRHWKWKFPRRLHRVPVHYFWCPGNRTRLGLTHWALQDNALDCALHLVRLQFNAFQSLEEELKKFFCGKIWSS